MRVRMPAGFIQDVMPGYGAFPACAVMHSEVSDN
jgi:hypothetical protein